MGARGRGGGGRGRGRGMSFSIEQLGFQPGEALPGPVLQPPPLYPPLENKPVPLLEGLEQEYLLVVKKEFQDYMKDSPAYVQPVTQKSDIERYSDRYQALTNCSRSGDLRFDWARFPKELNPGLGSKKRKLKKKAASVNLKVARRSSKPVDISNKLEELEKKEQQGSDAEEEAGEEEKANEEKREEEEEELEEDIDEEMDDGTDYVNSYFDNGEGYLDEEDDNLDDGPIY